MSEREVMYVEVDLSEENLTEVGLYNAGYRSGQKGQHWGDEQYMFRFPLLFREGHADGYGDWLRSIGGAANLNKWVKITEQNIRTLKPGTKFNGWAKDVDPNEDAFYRDDGASEHIKIVSHDVATEGVNVRIAGDYFYFEYDELIENQYDYYWFWNGEIK